jgi:spermidine synthase
MTVITLLGGIAIAATPSVVMALTNSLEVVAFKGSWSRYIGLIFRNGILIFGPAALLTGTLFPLLMKAEEQYAISAGRSIGRMAAINTTGSIMGALICGFVFLEHFGMWQSMQLLAGMYLLIAIIIPHTWNKQGLALKAIGIGTLTFTWIVLLPSELPITSIDPLRGPENILASWEGKDCTVAVTEDDYGLAIKINSHYGLGSTASYMQARMQNHIPLMAYPETESIFFLGMGTGITAGGSLDELFPNTREVIACELVPEVISAAKEYFTDYKGFDYTGGLFEDPRVTILPEDGRHYLMATDKRFDMINADLFVPFRIGDGSLYSLEHFQSVKNSLNPGGVFVQWLPLYMMTEYEFHVITRTMLEAFDQVSLWRANFQPLEEVVALVGHTSPFVMPPTKDDFSADRALAVKGKQYMDIQRLSLPLDSQSILFFYGANVTASRDMFSEYPINTDDHPLIEYMAPRTYRREIDGPTPWFVGPRILRFIEKLQANCPPDQDPLLSLRSDNAQSLPLAGTAFHRARIWETVGHEGEQQKAWNQFVEYWLGSPNQ